MSATVEVPEAIYKSLLSAGKDLIDAATAWDGEWCGSEADGESIHMKREINAMQQAIDQAELRGPLVTL